ncbi:MAG: signal peptidase I, partial [Lachnospiraceae bacterium]|nr:signal peptidase I [Lachnospiraceae bacterium]
MGRRKGLTFYEKEKKINKKLLKEIGQWIFWGAVMMLIAFVAVFCFGIRTSVIGGSMEPTLSNGQEILIDRFSYFFVSPGRGDVVVFLPNGNENSHYYVKRVIGLPGDTISIQDGY